MPAILFAGGLVLPGVAADPRAPGLAILGIYVLMLALQMLTTGIAEEPGWRDFALPRVQRRFGPLGGTLLLGPLWAGWHLPLFLTTWSPGPPGIVTIVLFFLTGIGLSVVITWLFNHTRESLPVAMLAHSSNNNFFSVLAPVIIPVVENSNNVLISSVIGYGVAAVILVTVTRGRLGYAPDNSALARNESAVSQRI